LSCDELVEQVLFVNQHLKNSKEKATNVVFMGMGEPFLNYENVVCAIEILNSENYLNIGARHITISTIGIIPRIHDFARLGLQVRLAISLHAPNDNLRNELMPINKKYPLSKLLETTDEFSKITNKRVSFEYVLIKGINTDLIQARKLTKLLTGLDAKVNLIPVSRFRNEFSPALKLDMILFRDILLKAGLPATIRRPRGADIQAACGQLRLRNLLEVKPPKPV